MSTAYTITYEEPINAFHTYEELINAFHTYEELINAFHTYEEPINAFYTYEEPINAFHWSYPGTPLVPIEAPVAIVEYYVYRCGPDNDHPTGSWKYFPVTMTKDQLPDIRVARPLYVWSVITGQYTPVKAIAVAY
jgi:hypothetical protein